MFGRAFLERRKFKSNRSSHFPKSIIKVKMGELLVPQTYPIFLSSLCKELWVLRQRIFEEVGHGTEVYVDERVNWRNTTHQEHLEVADDLIRRIREAKVFICILGGRRIGSPVKIETRPSAVSFFEIELFQAALLGKNVHLFVRDDFEPEPRLKKLLQIIGGAFPDWIEKKPLNDARILDEIQRLVDGERRKKLILPLLGFLNQFDGSFRRFPQELRIAHRRSNFFLKASLNVET